jgi:hypothetical protein
VIGEIRGIDRQPPSACADEESQCILVNGSDLMDWRIHDQNSVHQTTADNMQRRDTMQNYAVIYVKPRHPIRF